jgi:hypothetical protein
MTVVKWEVRAGAYYDSVVLMQLQRGLLGLKGVADAGVVMATPANRDLLAANNLLPENISANPDDLRWMNCSLVENHPAFHRISDLEV